MRITASLVGATVVTFTLAIGLAGCPRPNTEQAGPAFLALIVDSSASVAPLEPYILKYARFAMESYALRGPVHVALINLNEAPTVEFEQEGTLYDEEVDAVISHIKDINPDARGTDIIAAMELAIKYYTYQQVKPSAFTVMCFTDGHIDPPPGGSVRQWEDFDWTQFAQRGAKIGFYFVDVDPKLRDRIEAVLRSTSSSVVRNRNEAIDDVKKQEPILP